METEIIEINEGQRLSDIMEFIPENAIIQKTLPGIGATYLEITSKRNSIIIEPNVPVIEGKRKKHPTVLGVMEGVTKQHIVVYLESSVEFKKIITTPESYHKVQEAFKQLGINYFEDYFFLFDECERITQDIDYRETIDAPMEDFWNFKRRSFISATPIQPTAKDFTAKGFKYILIQPNYDYKQDILILKTYNVLAMVKKDLSIILKDKTKIVDTHCYFINSVDMIHCIIKDLDIKDISNIYSSVDAVKSFVKLGYKNTFSSLTPMNKFNFYTSRFFSAVDIEIDTKPNVTIVTDTIFAPHTMVIPQTESIQIVGRFRNGVKSVQHITNVNSLLPYKSIEDVKSDIKESANAYKTIFTLLKDSTSDGAKEVFNDALDRIEFAKLLTSDKSEINWFRYENKLLDQITKNIYHDLSYLLNAYQSSKFFNVKDLDFRNYIYDDKRFFQRARSTKKEMRKDIVIQLDNIDFSIIDDNVYEIESLEHEDSLIVSAYIKLGKDFIEKVDYNEIDLRIALLKKAGEEGESNLPVMDAILDVFIVDKEYTEKEIKAILTKINIQFEIEQKAKATDLEDYFNLSPRKTIRGRKEKDGKEVKGFTILSTKFNKRNLGQKATLLNTDEKCPGFFI